jgi:OCT family organic cation transporter-like MFS transporter 4/5
MLILVFFLIGKCASGAAFELIWVITAELYPTNLRSQAIGVCSTISRVFGMSAPFVAQLSMYWQPLPMLVLGIPSLISAFLVFFIPETKNRELPQTMNDSVKLDKVNTTRTTNEIEMSTKL